MNADLISEVEAGQRAMVKQGKAERGNLVAATRDAGVLKHVGNVRGFFVFL